MLTFAQCQKLTKRKGQKKLAGNTVLVKRDDTAFLVIFHTTNIIEIHADDTYTLNAGGFRTATTKARINQFSPAYIHQKDFAWYIGSTTFHNGCRVDMNGKLIAVVKETSPFAS